MSIYDGNRARGLFVDHTSIVVCLSDHEFPNCCIKTGLTATERHRQDFTKLFWTARYAAIVTLLAVGVVVAPRLAIRLVEYYRGQQKQRKFSLEYSLSPNWTGAEKKRSHRAVWLILAGVTVIFCGMVVAVMTDWGLAIVLLGALISTVGPALTALRTSDQPLVLTKLRGDFAWFRGCGKDFLFGLPSYVSSGHAVATIS